MEKNDNKKTGIGILKSKKFAHTIKKSYENDHKALHNNSLNKDRLHPNFSLTHSLTHHV